MMNISSPTRMTPFALLRRATALLVLLCAAFAPLAQAQTAGGTQIQNRASATYSDGTNSYSTVSNQVTVTVANVSGLTITPDGATNPTVVAGQTSVDFSFNVTNTSNFATQIRFLQSGGSIVLSGPATLAAAVVDTDNNGVGGADVDILGNTSSDVQYPTAGTVARNASFTVIVRVNINAAATPGSTINVRLGDATGGAPTYDNQPVATANLATAKVRTFSGTSAPVNGESEARGDISALVENDAQLKLSLTAPAGPVALGSNINYVWRVDNTGQRVTNAQTLAGAPAGSNTGVFVVAPIPAGTVFVSHPTLPAGVTVLYSTSSLANDPTSASTVWTTVAPVPGSITRVAYNLGNTLAAGAFVDNLNLTVQIQANINASTPIWEIGDALGRNRVNAAITDQSGDNVAGKGDGNANFNEPRFGVDPASATQGFQLPTTLTAVGSVLVGPQGQPAAVGPTDNNDDYTNRSSSAGIAGVAFGGATTAAGTVDFVNTVRNTGNANDTFTLSAPTVPAGFIVAISLDGTTFTTVSGGATVSLPLNFGQQADITVRVTAPTGSSILNGFATVIRAVSTNTPASGNNTIDRLYTGFLRLQKSYTIINGTGVGAATDAVPGAVIEYSIAYSNISTTGGTGNVTLTASSIVITEDGSVAPNNWAATTTQVVGSASDTRGGTITGDTAASNALTDTVTSLAPGQSGTFKFRRTIN